MLALAMMPMTMTATMPMAIQALAFVELLVWLRGAWFCAGHQAPPWESQVRPPDGGPPGAVGRFRLYGLSRGACRAGAPERRAGVPVVGAPVAGAPVAGAPEGGRVPGSGCIGRVGWKGGTG